jgi:pimeloyl-ACP methyl ester carboxylesterase
MDHNNINYIKSSESCGQSYFSVEMNSFPSHFTLPMLKNIDSLKEWNLPIAIPYETIATVLLVWLCIEVLFGALIHLVVLPKLQKLNKPPSYNGNIVEMMKRKFDIIKELDSYSFKKYICGFCRWANFEDICVDNVRSFLAWGMYHKSLDSLTWREQGEITEVMEHIALQHPEFREMSPGLNPNVDHCRMTLEPLPIVHRPFILYVLVNLTEALFNALFFHAGGFQRLEMNGTYYWYKNRNHGKGAVDCSGNEPMVFLHGISTGWMLYLQFVHALSRNRTVFLIDVEAIKVKSFNFDMPTPDEFVTNLVAILDAHSISKVSLIGHSFGSVTAGWTVTRRPDRVAHLTLIDPVSVLLGLPEVAMNFLYRRPSGLIEGIIYFGASMEITLSNALRRHFWWYNNNLALEDVPANIGIVVGVSAKDEIICAPAVYEYSVMCRATRLQLRKQQQLQQQQRRLQELHHSAVSDSNSPLANHVKQQQQFQYQRQLYYNGSDDGYGYGESSKSASTSVATSSRKSPCVSPVPAAVGGAEDLESRRLTRSMRNALATATSFDCLRSHHDSMLSSSADFTAESSKNSIKSTHSSSSKSAVAGARDIDKVAGMECVMWENFSHGQILLPGRRQKQFIELVHRNEKVSSSG